jgi:AraC-like DNA-binding protein
MVLNQIIDRCQMLTAQSSTTAPASLTPEIRKLIGSVPQSISTPERLILGSVLGQVLGRFARRDGVDQDPRVARAFVAVAASMSSGEAWRTELERLLECYLAACRNQSSVLAEPQANVDMSLRRPLRFIESHYTDPGLALRAVATHIRRSRDHTGRMLRRYNGVGFVVYLRRRRVRAAECLLQDSLLTMKEIATAAGFGYASRFSRDFKDVCGVSPTWFRHFPTSERPLLST